MLQRPPPLLSSFVRPKQMTLDTHALPKKRSWAFVSLISAFVGLAVWVLAVVVVSQEVLVSVWGHESVAYSVGHLICTIIAAPIAALGWMFVWGDNGPPYSWMDSYAFNLSTSVIISMAAGAAIGNVVVALRSGLSKSRLVMA